MSLTIRKKMLIRTHLAIAVFFILLFLPSVSSKIIFSAVVLAATFLPDLDSAFSTIGKFKVSRVMQLFIKHRGFLHSFTLCIIVSIILAFFLPVLSLGFFLGYSLHLLEDSFSINGIRFFWPLKKTSSGWLRTGSLFETNLFIIFILVDLIVFMIMMKRVF